MPSVRSKNAEQTKGVEVRVWPLYPLHPGRKERNCRLRTDARPGLDFTIKEKEPDTFGSPDAWLVTDRGRRFPGRTFIYRYYRPRQSDLDLIRQMYPDDDPHEPSWVTVRADILAAHLPAPFDALESLIHCTAPDLLRALVQARRESRPLVRDQQLQATGQPTVDSTEAALAGIPPLDTDSPDWVRTSTAAKVEGKRADTLGKYRSMGTVAPDRMSGRDKFGRVWRRQGTRKSQVYYYRPSLLTSQLTG